MFHPPVHWHEGMFLRPQHFQAADRYWAETLHTSGQWDHEYNYGLRAVELSQEAIANHQVQLTMCQARLKDGTLVSLAPGEEPDRVDLKESITGIEGMMVGLADAFDKSPVVRVYLGVPKLKLGTQNVAADAGKQRYISEVRQIDDDATGGSDQEIQLRRVNVKLLLSTHDLSGYELLPIAQIRRSSEGEALPKLDENYIPPVLAVDAWAPLSRDYVRAIYDIIGQRIELRTQQIVNRGITLVSHDARDLERLFMLGELNAAYCVLGVLAFARGVHPFVAYTELCRIVGQLSIFGSQRRPPEIPQYDHDDLARIFAYVKRQILELLDSIPEYEFEQRYFIGEGLGMAVRLEPKWFNVDWSWYVGVQYGSLTEPDCRLILSDLDWKLGSSREVDRLFRERSVGLELVPPKQVPRALPSGRGWLYFEVGRQNAAWKEVVDTGTLGMRLKEASIVNRAKLEGERTLVVSARGKVAELQFALFAVPHRQ